MNYLILQLIVEIILHLNNTKLHEKAKYLLECIGGLNKIDKINR